LGAVWCFTANGLSYLAPIASLLAVRTRFRPKKTTESMLYSMKQGISFIRCQGSMESLIALAFGMTILGIPVVVFLPVFARDVFERGPEIYTLLLSLSGVGSIVGGLLVAALGHRERKGLVTLAGLIVLGVMITGFAFSTNLVLSCVLLFIAGAALIAVFALVTSLVQLITPDEMRGRVMSVYNVAFRGGMPIGSLIVGSLVPLYTAPVVIGASGAMLTAMGLIFLFGHRKIASL
jgi:predicted MFS family arabinose efflux permease